MEPWDQEHRHHHINTRALKNDGDVISSRIPLFLIRM
jgi:hypothetical protein